MVGCVVITFPRLLSSVRWVQVVQDCRLACIGQPQYQNLKVFFGAEEPAPEAAKQTTHCKYYAFMT